MEHTTLPCEGGCKTQHSLAIGLFRSVADPNPPKFVDTVSSLYRPAARYLIQPLLAAGSFRSQEIEGLPRKLQGRPGAAWHCDISPLLTRALCFT